MPQIGDEFAGYSIERLLGRGGMGVVYLAEHIRLRQRRALKLLPPDLAHNDDFRQRFERESRLAASLEHPIQRGGDRLLQHHRILAIRTGGSAR